MICKEYKKLLVRKTTLPIPAWAPPQKPPIVFGQPAFGSLPWCYIYNNSAKTWGSTGRLYRMRAALFVHFDHTVNTSSSLRLVDFQVGTMCTRAVSFSSRTPVEMPTPILHTKMPTTACYYCCPSRRMAYTLSRHGLNKISRDQEAGKFKFRFSLLCKLLLFAHPTQRKRFLI